MKIVKISAIIFLAILFIVIIFPTAFIVKKNGKTTDEEILVSKALSSKLISLFSFSIKRDVYDVIGKKKVNYSMLNVNFKDANELLNGKNTKFYSVKVNISKNVGDVIVIYYKSGIQYNFKYNLVDGNWKNIDSHWGRVKIVPSKPYYIYLENMRLTDDHYKNYRKDLIPRDSLK